MSNRELLKVYNILRNGSLLSNLVFEEEVISHSNNKGLQLKTFICIWKQFEPWTYGDWKTIGTKGPKKSNETPGEGCSTEIHLSTYFIFFIWPCKHVNIILHHAICKNEAHYHSNYIRFHLFHCVICFVQKCWRPRIHKDPHKECCQRLISFHPID